jgi:hypothetical protein
MMKNPILKGDTGVYNPVAINFNLHILKFRLNRYLLSLPKRT